MSCQCLFLFSSFVASYFWHFLGTFIDILSADGERPCQTARMGTGFPDFHICWAYTYRDFLFQIYIEIYKIGNKNIKFTNKSIMS